ncbi:MAG: hypothetical protein B1H12_04050 [Desulfobacteraceae bacterium 4484_190.2]|nr:MAG: hypothetical protein B1H12_04050 [Desulfobacteraceae bacterium 4484_190.2]
MKCPKCNYVSFDYNQVCPKCNKDISTEQKRMNLPDYRPSPLSLLGSLMGEPGQSEDSVFEEDQNLDMDFEITGNGEAEKLEEASLGADLLETNLLDEEEEIEHLEPLSDFEEEEGEKISPESIEISLDDSDRTLALSDTGEMEMEELISLDSDELPLAEPELEQEAFVESGPAKEKELGIDLEDLSLDEIAPPTTDAGEDDSLNEAEMVTLVIEKKDPKVSHGLEDTELDLELDLDELEEK